MPLQDWMQIISVDDHLIEHPKVWTDRLPEKYKEDGPQIIETPEGHHVWRYQGEIYPYIGLNAVAGKEPKDFGLEPVRYDQMIPGCYDPDERIKDMDIDGVQAALCFPSFPGFGGGVFHRSKDKELALETVKAWNDFMVDEWCATDPERLIPLAILPTWDVDLAVAEFKRAAERGARTVSFPDAPAALGMPGWESEYWYPVFDVANETGVSLSLHFGSGSFVPGFGGSASAAFPNPENAQESSFVAQIPLYSTNLMWAVSEIAFSGSLQKFPNLKILLAEGGIGWLPYLTERIDYTWERHRYYTGIDQVTRPSELIHKHFWGCYIDDNHGIANRHEIGVDRILVEVDYPHSDSQWPHSRKIIGESLVDVPDDEAHMIVETNAREVLMFPRSAA